MYPRCINKTSKSMRPRPVDKRASSSCRARRAAGAPASSTLILVIIFQSFQISYYCYMYLISNYLSLVCLPFVFLMCLEVVDVKSTRLVIGSQSYEMYDTIYNNLILLDNYGPIYYNPARRIRNTRSASRV